MTEKEFFEMVKSEGYVKAGSEAHLVMHELAQHALKITAEINNRYHTKDELLNLMRSLTENEVDESFNMFPPFYSDCGKNIHIGKNVFINAGCKFQDQGGIYIGDGSLIGHNAVLVTINHDERVEERASMYLKAIHIGKNVWIGANVTILPGVSVGDGAIIAAGAVVSKNVPENSLVAGVPARVIKKIAG